MPRPSPEFTSTPTSGQRSPSAPMSQPIDGKLTPILSPTPTLSTQGISAADLDMSSLTLTPTEKPTEKKPPLQHSSTHEHPQALTNQGGVTAHPSSTVAAWQSSPGGTTPPARPAANAPQFVSGMLRPGSSVADRSAALATMDFVQRWESSLDDFDPSLFQLDGDINFERDFGQWFNPDDVGDMLSEHSSNQHQGGAHCRME